MRQTHGNTSERAVVISDMHPYIHISSVLHLQYHFQVGDLGWVLNPAPLPLIGID